MVPDRNSYPRPVELPERYRTRRFAAQAQLIDLSEHACQLRGCPPRGRTGDRIRICLAGLEPLSGKVKWMRHGDVGVQFNRPLHPAVVDHIATKCQNSAHVEWL